jgi:hypothetical protein
MCYWHVPVLGGTPLDPNLDGTWSGVALEGRRTLCRVWGLGPRRWNERRCGRPAATSDGIRAFRSKRRRRRWSVSGPKLPVHAFVVEVPGYRNPWCLVTTALELAATKSWRRLPCAFGRKTASATTHNASAGKNAGAGPRSLCCARSRCRWSPWKNGANPVRSLPRKETISAGQPEILETTVYCSR